MLPQLLIVLLLSILHVICVQTCPSVVMDDFVTVSFGLGFSRIHGLTNGVSLAYRYDGQGLGCVALPRRGRRACYSALRQCSNL
jgi:hypothetical protein